MAVLASALTSPDAPDRGRVQPQRPAHRSARPTGALAQSRGPGRANDRAPIQGRAERCAR